MRNVGARVQIAANLASIAAFITLVGCVAVGLVAHDALSSVGRVAITVGAFVGFGVLFLPVVRPHALTPRRVVVAAALLIAIAVITPPRGSHDLWSYTMYGRILSVHHSSPFTSLPADFPRDPVLHLVASGWRHTASVYGPGFVALAGAGTAITGRSLLANRLLFQGIEALALVGALALVWRRTRDPAAIALLGLNPALLAIVNGGHNDLLVGFALLAGTLLMVDDRPRSAGVVLALGALVKLVLMLPVGALLVWAWRRKGAQQTVSTALSLGALLVGAYAVAGGAAALEPLLNANSQRSRAAVWRLPTHWLLRPLGVDQAGIQSLIDIMAPVTIVLVVTIVVIGALRHRRESRPPSTPPATAAVVVAGAAGLVFLFGASYVLPWYSAWALPLLALVWRSRLTVAATVQSVLVAVAYSAPLPTDDLFAVYVEDVVPIAAVVALGFLVASAWRGTLAEPVRVTTACPERESNPHVLADKRF